MKLTASELVEDMEPGDKVNFGFNRVECIDGDFFSLQRHALKGMHVKRVGRVRQLNSMQLTALLKKEKGEQVFVHTDGAILPIEIKE